MVLCRTECVRHFNTLQYYPVTVLVLQSNTLLIPLLTTCVWLDKSLKPLEHYLVSLDQFEG